MIASLIDTRPNPPETTKSTKLKVSTPATEGYYDDDAISLLLSDALFNKLLDTRSGMRLLQCISFCLSQLFCFASFENLMLQSTNNYVLFFLVVCVFRFFADTLLIESRRFCFLNGVYRIIMAVQQPKAKENDESRRGCQRFFVVDVLPLCQRPLVSPCLGQA